MTKDQVSDTHILEWVRACLDEDCDQYERSSSVLAQLDELKLAMMNVLHALRTATEVVRDRFAGGCLIVRSRDLDGRVVSIVIAPPSVKHRVRVVKVWLGR